MIDRIKPLLAASLFTVTAACTSTTSTAEPTHKPDQSTFTYMTRDINNNLNGLFVVPRDEGVPEIGFKKVKEGEYLICMQLSSGRKVFVSAADSYIPQKAAISSLPEVDSNCKPIDK